MANSKALFAAIPERAICDRRLAAIHFRILAAIALHDRMSSKRKKGAGCYASNKTLADACNVNYSNFSTAVHELGAWGYIEAAAHPISKRTRIYRVVYDGEQQADSLPTGKPSPPTNTLPTGKPSDEADAGDSLPNGNDHAEAVCPPNSQAADFIQQPNDKYIPLNGKRFSETERDSVETASLRSVGLRNGEGNGTVGAYLAQLERYLKQQGEDAQLDQEAQEYLDVLAEGELEDPNTRRAARILDQWGAA